MNLQVLTVLAVVVGVCQSAGYSGYKGWKDDCNHPSWKCDCKIVHHCKHDGVLTFPHLAEDEVAGYVEDLAPDSHPIRISGASRRNARTQEAFCKEECHDRLNAFLCLDNRGGFTDYSYSAVCLKMFDLGIFFEDGSDEPCCTLWLEYGRQWCPKKCNRLLDTVRCLSLGIDSVFDDDSPAGAFHCVFGAEGGCDISTGLSFPWCASQPLCPD